MEHGRDLVRHLRGVDQAGEAVPAVAAGVGVRGVEDVGLLDAVDREAHIARGLFRGGEFGEVHVEVHAELAREQERVRGKAQVPALSDKGEMLFVSYLGAVGEPGDHLVSSRRSDRVLCVRDAEGAGAARVRDVVDPEAVRELVAVLEEGLEHDLHPVRRIAHRVDHLRGLTQHLIVRKRVGRQRQREREVFQILVQFLVSRVIEILFGGQHDGSHLLIRKQLVSPGRHVRIAHREVAMRREPPFALC